MRCANSTAGRRAPTGLRSPPPTLTRRWCGATAVCAMKRLVTAHAEPSSTASDRALTKTHGWHQTGREDGNHRQPPRRAVSPEPGGAGGTLRELSSSAGAGAGPFPSCSCGEEDRPPRKSPATLRPFPACPSQPARASGTVAQDTAHGQPFSASSWASGAPCTGPARRGGDQAGAAAGEAR